MQKRKTALQARLAADLAGSRLGWRPAPAWLAAGSAGVRRRLAAGKNAKT